MTSKTAIDTNAEPPSDVLAQLRRVVVERGDLERREAVLVRRARNEGLAWQHIAAALDVSRQAVHKKHAAGIRRR